MKTLDGGKMNDPLTIKSLPWVIKIWAAVMGGILLSCLAVILILKEKLKSI